MKFTVCFLLALGLIAAPPDKDKKLYPAAGGNEKVEIEAKLFLTREEATQALGADPGPGIIVVAVKVSPKGDEELSVSPDDFYLKSDRDGQRTQPFGPSQIAGQATLMIKSQTTTSAVAADRGPGRVIGGIPGTGTPPIMAPDQGAMAGNTSVNETQLTAGETKTEEKVNPLLAKLKSKVLMTGNTKDAVEGLLYFPIEGKQRRKDLELSYRGPAGRLVMRWPQ